MDKEKELEKGNIAKELKIYDEKQDSYSNKLEKCSDGNIIGDGSADYTREVSKYEFKNKNAEFIILDLPGIEGKEEIVIDEINKASQKAHAIFYVTKSPTPPQKGDNDDGGTLARIKKHLGQQTEVYAIFNKPTTSPRAIPNEVEPLMDLDKIMKDYIGENYNKSITICAYPAFLSICNCWNNDNYTKRQKFLEHFKSYENMLNKSYFNNLLEHFESNVINNCEAKIKKSNFNKMANVLEDTNKDIKFIHNTFEDGLKETIKSKKNADAQLDSILDGLGKKIKAENKREVDSLESKIRKEIYDEIDKEIDNDTFKDKLKGVIEQNNTSFEKNIKKRYSDAIEEFKNNIEKTINQHEKNTVEIFDTIIKSSGIDKDYNIKIDIKNNNLNWGGVISSAVGVVLSIVTFPLGGVVVLVLSIVGFLFNIGKSIAGYFNHQYRASQQKKSADENIARISKSVNEKLNKECDNMINKLKENIKDIKEKLKTSINIITELNNILKLAGEKFLDQAKELKIKGEN